MKLLFVYVGLLAVHWVADFVLQTDWQATNKSKNNYALGAHVLTYTLALGGFAGAVLDVSSATFLFIAGNGVLHFCTDWATSRGTSHLWQAGKRHDFFVLVGLDQLIHHLTLAATLCWWDLVIGKF